jgi:hypothetical protein
MQQPKKPWSRLKSMLVAEVKAFSRRMALRVA